MAVDRRAQVVHHRLADEVREKRLPHADHAGHDRDRDHPRDEGGEEAELDRCLPGLRVDLDRGVEHRAEEERRDDAEPGRDDDQAADERQAGAVRPEQPDDPAEVRLADGGVCRALRRLAGHEGVEAATWHEVECA